MNIAVIGIRGIPVTYSAFETFANVFGVELVKRNHQVTVYCRRGLISNENKTHNGVKLITHSHIPTKSLSTLSHSFLATISACLYGKYDVILYLGVGNVIFSVIPRLFGIKTVVHIDGMDWKRSKWGVIGRGYLQLSEYLTTFLPTAVITDSQYMITYYKKRYAKTIHYIPYGYFPLPKKANKKNLFKKYHVEEKKYFVWVGRLVPDNHIEDFIEAFEKIDSADIFAVILGDDLYETEYKKNIYSLLKKNKKIIFNGFIPHDDVLLLESGSLAYIETKRSGGTHVSLVEAMGVGSLIVSHSNQANMHILGNDALFYTKQSKTKALDMILKDIIKNQRKFDKQRKGIQYRAEKNFVWSKVIDEYESLFLSLLR